MLLTFLPISLRKVFISTSIFVLTILYCLALKSQPADLLNYSIFTILSSVLFLNMFKKNVYFVEIFAGLYLWMGLWFKYTYTFIFRDGFFHDPVGQFFINNPSFNNVINVASIGIVGFLIAILIKEYFLKVKRDEIDKPGFNGIYYFYEKNRKIILFMFLFIVFLFFFINYEYQIIRRGHIDNQNFNYPIIAFFKWTIFFGFTSLSALFLRFDLLLSNKNYYITFIISLFELAASNISILSRGMILNAGSIYIPFIHMLYTKYKVRSLLPFIFFSLTVIFTFIFTLSAVQNNRLESYCTDLKVYHHCEVNEKIAEDGKKEISTPKDTSLGVNSDDTLSLFVARWVGIEGIMSVSSYEDKSFRLFKKSLSEYYNKGKVSLYDRIILKNKTVEANPEKFNFISVPGIFAYLYYSGSYLFVFIMSILLFTLIFILENIIFKLSRNNIILTGLFVQIISYRIAAFGFTPLNSYILLITIFFNLYCFHILDYFLIKFIKHNKS